MSWIQGIGRLEWIQSTKNLFYIECQLACRVRKKQHLMLCSKNQTISNLVHTIPPCLETDSDYLFYLF